MKLKEKCFLPLFLVSIHPFTHLSLFFLFQFNSNKEPLILYFEATSYKIADECEQAESCLFIKFLLHQ